MLPGAYGAVGLLSGVPGGDVGPLSVTPGAVVALLSGTPGAADVTRSPVCLLPTTSSGFSSTTTIWASSTSSS